MLARFKSALYLVLILFIFHTIYLSAFFVLQGEVHLTNDIGRDFLLLQELDQKKIVLIGPRTNVPGVFHGPLWTYMNYPAFLLGQGDPVTVGYFWIILGIIFLATTFLILRKLTNTTIALLGVCCLGVTYIHQANSLFGQIATYFFMPVFLYTMYLYIKQKKALFLILHFTVVGIFVQLNIGIGGLFALLSLALSFGIIIKRKQWRHLLCFIALPITVSTYILFDLKHNFTMIKELFGLGTTTELQIPFSTWIKNRYDYLFSLQLFPAGNILSFLIFLILMFVTYLEIRKKTKNRTFFLIILFYYFGYMILNWFNKGIMLVDYVYLLVPLTVFWITLGINGKYRNIFLSILLLAIIFNYTTATNYLKQSKQHFIGKSADSWISLKTVSQSVINNEKGKPFGFFVYSPDSFAYQQRYAITYAFKHAQSFEYIKKPTTYVIASPHPIDKPYMNEDWWINNKAKISNKPVSVKVLPSGYIIKKFQLTSDQQKIPHEPDIELGIHFR